MTFMEKNPFKNIKWPQDRLLAWAFVGLGAVSLLSYLLTPSSTPTVAMGNEHESRDVDTMIPAGYLLIPIELANAESFSSLTGAFALVDLFTPTNEKRKGFKVASSVKLVKAPLNPQQFAVLIPEADSARIVSTEGPFFAALKNPRDARPAEAAPPPKKSAAPFTIQYGD